MAGGCRGGLPWLLSLARLVKYRDHLLLQLRHLLLWDELCHWRSGTRRRGRCSRVKALHTRPCTQKGSPHMRRC